ncbi:MAG: helix-turn-helix domain-containing protein [Ignavibacteriaceae bacterium]|nr:helix-turn-helix domain-containing protein [Ignavibacteriaceae bacterium]
MTHQELGQQLKIAREQLGFEIKESAASIKIDAKFVEKMEIGDFTFLPDVYVRSFLKEYAIVLHLDPDEVLEAYKGLRKAPEVKHPPVQAPPPTPVHAPPPPPPPPPSRRRLTNHILMNPWTQSHSNHKLTCNRN